MASIYDINPQKLIKAVAEILKKEEAITPPEWAPFVKTGISKQRVPEDADWWFIRSAAILRTIYKEGVIGTSKLRSKYGGKQNRGRKPEKFKKGSGNIIRKILQQLEKAGLVKKEEKKISKGRKLTKKGQSLLDNIANSLAGAKSKIEKKAETKEVIVDKKIKIEEHKHEEINAKPKVSKISKEKSSVKKEVVK